MKFQLDDRPILRMAFDGGMILTASLAVIAGKSKHEERAATEQTIVLTQEKRGVEQYAKGLEGQLQDAEETAQHFADRGKEMGGIISALTIQLGEQGEQFGEVQAELNQLRPGGPCDAIFLIDTSGSTDSYHDHISESLKALFRWAPRLSSELRVGVIPFRDGCLTSYPLTSIRPRDVDNGRSQDSLLEFIDNLHTEVSAADHLPAFREAFKMLDASRGEDRRAVVILVSDIGPSELDSTVGYSPAETRQAKRIVDGVNRWVSGGMRTVAAIYLGNKASDSFDAQWFRSLSLPDSSNFASDSSQIFNVIFSTIEK